MNAPASSEQPPQDDPKPSIEQRAEAWGRNIEQHINRLTARLPAPIHALLDLLCLGVILFGILWLLDRQNWLPMPSRPILASMAAILYITSLATRLSRPPRK